jgi:hypothetical protein
VRRATRRFLRTGKDNYWNIQYQGLQGISNYFPVDEGGQTRAYIMTPKKEQDPAVSGAAPIGDPNVYYEDGLYYEDEIIALMAEIGNIIPGIPIAVYDYAALNRRDKRPHMEKLFYTRRGKAFFQYDPRANTQNRRGARLYMEGELMHNEFWYPEERLLSTPEIPQPLPLSCGEQVYDYDKVWFHHCRIFVDNTMY